MSPFEQMNILQRLFEGSSFVMIKKHPSGRIVLVVSALDEQKTEIGRDYVQTSCGKCGCSFVEKLKICEERLFIT